MKSNNNQENPTKKPANLEEYMNILNGSNGEPSYVKDLLDKQQSEQPSSSRQQEKKESGITMEEYIKAQKEVRKGKKSKTKKGQSKQELRVEGSTSNLPKQELGGEASTSTLPKVTTEMPPKFPGTNSNRYDLGKASPLQVPSGVVAGGFVRQIPQGYQNPVAPVVLNQVQRDFVNLTAAQPVGNPTRSNSSSSGTEPKCGDAIRTVLNIATGLTPATDPASACCGALVGAALMPGAVIVEAVRGLNKVVKRAASCCCKPNENNVDQPSNPTQSQPRGI